MNWSHRSYQKELLDRTDIPFADIQKNMEELDVINQRLGGHAITQKGLQALLKKQLFQKPISVLEIGCGGGDNLRALKAWAAEKKIDVQLTGVDINDACIAFAKAQPRNAGIRFFCSDYKTVAEEHDVIFASLFCHHFTDDELVAMLRWLQQHARIGFFINDLHRHPLAYHSIKLLTKAFSKSYLVKNDAPLSVQRGFTRGEWQQLFQKAMLSNYTIEWQWAFRWLITCTKL